MTRRSTPHSRPHTWLVEGQWPTGAFAADAPEALAYAVHIAKTLQSVLEGANKTQVAADAHIERSTLYDLLAGNTWADLATLAKLEGVLGVSLWPSEPPSLTRALGTVKASSPPP